MAESLKKDGLMGLARPLFIFRAPSQLGGPCPSRVQIRATKHSSPESILSAIVSRFEDLSDPVQVEPWRFSNRYVEGNVKKSEASPLLSRCAFRSFGLRPHGVIEVALRQKEFSFPTVLPVAVNVVSLGEFLAS